MEKVAKKPVVITVVVERKIQEGDETSINVTRILTQTRRITEEGKRRGYDLWYDLTEEVVGESAKPGESWEQTALRGCEEELGFKDVGHPDIVSRNLILGQNTHSYSTREMDGKQDLIIGFSVFCVAQIEGPQLWIGPCAVLMVNEGFEPQPDKEGEVAAHHWWEPSELLKELEEHPEKFMGLHYPWLLKVSRSVVRGYFPLGLIY